MQTRGKFLNVQHTLSHLEHIPTEDADLYARRKVLVKADKQADLGHEAFHPISDNSGIEAFALCIHCNLVEMGLNLSLPLFRALPAENYYTSVGWKELIIGRDPILGGQLEEGAGPLFCVAFVINL
jgi:hypothetical protein